MKKKTNLLLFLICISFFSCNSEKNPNSYISNLDSDFPTTESLEFKSFNKYDILVNGYYIIDDSTLWHFFEDENCVGYCYDLHTGKQLSNIAMKGHAANEFENLNLYKSKLMGDSIQLVWGNTIKSFAKRDIIENKPMNQRIFSVASAPDSIHVANIMKLSNGSLLATIGGNRGVNLPPEIFDINNKSVAIINNGEVKGYETINYDSFDIKKEHPRLQDCTPNFIIKKAYSYGDMEIKGNDMAVFSVLHQFILYTLDLNNGNVLKEKRYTNLLSTDVSHKTTNDMEMRVGYIESNDRYIFCAARGYFNKKDKELKERKYALFVFDWDLNPIKRFDLPIIDRCFYIVSNDCKAIYRATFIDGEGLTLSKADLLI